MSPHRSLADESKRFVLVIAKHRKSQPIVLREPVDKHPVQNVVEHLPQGIGESDALQTRGLHYSLHPTSQCAEV